MLTSVAARSAGREPAVVEASELLEVRRRDIQFRDVAPGRVAIAVTVTNLGDGPSAPTHALVQSATFGAFVPWSPLAVLPVPSLEPGESTTLHTEARRPVVRPLGPPDRLPPSRLLTALGFGDDERDSRPAAPAQRRSIFRWRRGSAPAAPTDGAPAQGTTLLASTFDLVSGRTTHWAGNLNVFIGMQAVERHMARAVRILPGHVNVALFCVGGGGSDAYRFELRGLGSNWSAGLFDPAEAFTLAGAANEKAAIELGAWIPGRRCRVVLLALTPPAGCAQGEVEVHVTQRSTGRSAVVEFSFDPHAAGPGCYVVG